MTTGQRPGCCSQELRKAQAARERPGRGRTLPQSRGGPAPPTPGPWTCGLRSGRGTADTSAAVSTPRSAGPAGEGSAGRPHPPSPCGCQPRGPPPAADAAAAGGSAIFCRPLVSHFHEAFISIPPRPPFLELITQCLAIIAARTPGFLSGLRAGRSIGPAWHTPSRPGPLPPWPPGP